MARQVVEKEEEMTMTLPKNILESPRRLKKEVMKFARHSVLIQLEKELSETDIYKEDTFQFEYELEITFRRK